MSPGASGRTSRRGVRAGWGGRIAASAALFTAALAVRALPAPTVLLADSVQPFGGDAFYHLRRIAVGVARFPRALGFDPYLDFPSGANAIWTPTFDWIVAGLAVACGAQPASLQMERLAVWVPPLLGAATVVALAALAGRAFDRWTGGLAGALACVMSGHFWYSQIGFVDHHAAVALATTLLLGAALAQIRNPTAARSALLGAALGAALCVWPGALLHVGLVEVFLALRLVADRNAPPVAAALRFAALQLVALALVAPLAASGAWPQWSDYSPVVLSRFHLWWFGALTAFGIGWAVRAAVAGTPRGFADRAVTAAALLAAIGGASALAWPQLAVGASDALQWFGRDEPFQAMVSESMPLLWAGGGFSWEPAWVRLSPFAFAAPPALAAMGIAARRRRSAPLALIAVWSAGLLTATLFQKRFFNTSSLAVALVAAWALAEGARRAARTARRPLATTRRVALVIAALGMAPVVASYRGDLANWLDRGAISASPLQLDQQVGIAMALTLRRTTPPTRGWLDPDLTPEYGVLAPWTVGHAIEYVARRPSVTSGFGDDVGPENFETARRYYLADERVGAQIADALSVRFAVAQRSAKFLGEEAPNASLLVAMYERDGAARAGRPALSRHRLLFESAPPGRRAAERESLFKVFEIVDGAELVGRARRGGRVDARLGVTTNRGRRFDYTASARIGPDGRFRLRVPYATEGADDSAVRVDGPLHLSCGSAEARVAIPETAVTTGAVVPVPDLECAPEKARTVGRS